MFQFDLQQAKWIHPPKTFTLGDGQVEIVTDPHTDLWQRTYYGFQNDNGHILYNTTQEKYFSFTVETIFESKVLFDQCGVAIYQNNDCWFKSGVEKHDNDTGWLGSVVTNRGYSDWATTDVGSHVDHVWYRLSRRESDFCIENSFDGVQFHQMRIFHLDGADGEIRFGIIACSPGNSSFKAIFKGLTVTECLWKLHE